MSPLSIIRRCHTDRSRWSSASLGGARPNNRYLGKPAKLRSLSGSRHQAIQASLPAPCIFKISSSPTLSAATSGSAASKSP
jgi:hypothetical protein